MGVNQRRQLHPLHLFEQQRNVVDALRDDVRYLIHAQSLAQSGIYLQIWANRESVCRRDERAALSGSYLRPASASIWTVDKLAGFSVKWRSYDQTIVVFVLTEG